MSSTITTSSEPHNISVELVKASIEYMRTPTPEFDEVSNAGQCWILDSSSSKPWFLHEPSSPVLSCPPSWLETGREHESSEQETVDYADDDDAPLEVPFSSSPPDAASSSPKSAGSNTSENTATSPTPGNLAYSEPPAQDELSLTNIPAEDTGSDFGHKLHHLLLLALKERDNDTEACDAGSLSSAESSDYDSSVSSSGYAWTSGQQSRQEGGNEYKESSPSRFEAIGFDKRRFASKLDPTLTFRLIKRAQSYVVPEDCNEPVLKRQKLTRDPGLHANARIYAHRTASLRRADSLKSVPEQAPVPHDWVPTVPATPIATTPKPNGRNGANLSQGSSALMPPVPIIAPPEGHIPKFPSNAETLAKMRLIKYLEREASGRETDGLPAGVYQRPPPWMVKANIDGGLPLVNFIHEENTWTNNVVVEWEIVLGVGRKRREAAINWLLDVLPIRAPGRASSPESLSSNATSYGSCSSGSYYSSSTSSSQYTTSTPDVPGNSRPIYNLQDQLENSPETRFHAAWMFLRYFYLTMSPVPENTSKNSHTRTSRTVSRANSLDQEGLGLVVWDIAVACLAISVKFHRDFLRPLLPVFADEYVNLAPHAISLEDLESAHRDILSVFDYRLGITPQPVMDELWAALPSLRNLLDFKSGWENAKLEAWTRLFAILDEPDIQRFLVSVLTVVALMDGIVGSLVDNLCREQELKQRRVASTVAERYVKSQLLRRKLAIEAKDEAEGVFCDIQALTGVTDANIRECRLWMTGRN